jgi:hypothetical protein
MLKPTEENFLTMFFSSRKVVSELYCPDGVIYCWVDLDVYETLYLVSPKTFALYSKFVKQIKKEAPLLLELR